MFDDLELWGGHEPTVVRLGDRYRDQTRLTGHHDRIDDIARFAALGIKRLRYPVLWERVAPDDPLIRDWRWSDERITEIERQGMRPIVGLLHHGGAPRYTGLLDPNMPALFADFARAAAERYPHVTDWTPVNEPLTTARFAALYGHWHPHERNDRAFFTALVTQVEAVAAAMRAIRGVIPHARLIQTDDLGHCWAEPPHQHKADYFNERRWLGWDLLAGRVMAGHFFYDELTRHGLGHRVRALSEQPCPPDVIGVNHYVTSDRFLVSRDDGDFEDVTAARVMDPPPAGLEQALREAWARYATPLAVTESHLGCTREEQMRWVHEGWQTCVRMRDAGVRIEGFTVWSLLGAVDWNSLITCEEGHYESGAFDMRGPTPRLTALGALVASLSSGGSFARQALLDTPGWWQRDARFEQADVLDVATPSGPPILIAGATGTLGQALARQCRLRGLAHVVLDRRALDVTDEASLAEAIETFAPWAIVNATGWVRVDEAEHEAEACMAVNRDGAAALARAAKRHGCRYAAFSSDLVFDGRRDIAYVESDATAPLSVYGRSKAEAEDAILRAAPDALIARTAAFFSPHDPHNFAWWVEHRLRRGEAVPASGAHVVSPTYVRHLVDAVLDLLIDGEGGIWHLANEGGLSWLDFAARVAGALDLDPAHCRDATPDELGWLAPRPAHVPLASARGQLLPRFEVGLKQYAALRTQSAPVSLRAAA